MSILAKSAFAQWTVDDTISFFEAYGIYGQEKTLGQLFPTTNKAKDVVQVFTDLCRDMGQEIRCDVTVNDIYKVDEGFIITYEKDGREVQLQVPKKWS